MEQDSPKKPRLTRRGLLKAAGSFAVLGGATGLYTWRIEPHWMRFVERDLPIRNLPGPLAGRTLAQVSDIHVGPVGEDYLLASFAELGARSPDLIVFTGDFMSCQRDERIDDVARIMEHAPDAPLGRYAIMGNHDYGGKWGDSSVADKLTTRLEDLGIIVLRNARRSVTGLSIVGLDDLWSPNWGSAKTAMASLTSEEPAVVLCHNPDACDLPIWGNYRGWVLSGHTHGGQCKAPFLPPPILPVKNRRYTAGEFALSGGRSLYINRGLGYVQRVRFNVRPEITLFRMTEA